jgi:hypothetical protein
MQYAMSKLPQRERPGLPLLHLLRLSPAYREKVTSIGNQKNDDAG